MFRGANNSNANYEATNLFVRRLPSSGGTETKAHDKIYANDHNFYNERNLEFSGLRDKSGDVTGRHRRIRISLTSFLFFFFSTFESRQFHKFSDLKNSRRGNLSARQIYNPTGRRCPNNKMSVERSLATFQDFAFLSKCLLSRQIYKFEN